MAEITLHKAAIHTNGELPKIGTKAPDFTLIDQELKERRLQDFSQEKILLVTVPSLDTPVCLTSAKKFNSAMQKRTDFVVLYISADLPFAEKRVCNSEHLNNIQPLSMMRDRKFAQDYGILIVDGPLAGLAARAIIGLDKEKRVIYTERLITVAETPKASST